MRNRLINIKKSKFIQKLKKEFHSDEFFNTKVDKIVIKKSKTPETPPKRVLTLEAFGKNRDDLLHEMKINYVFLEKEQKLALIYHVIALLCENEVDLVEYWNYILEYPDELIESEYNEDEY